MLSLKITIKFVLPPSISLYLQLRFHDGIKSNPLFKMFNINKASKFERKQARTTECQLRTPDSQIGRCWLQGFSIDMESTYATKKNLYKLEIPPPALNTK